MAADFSARHLAISLVCVGAFAAIVAVYGLSLETVELLSFATILLFLSLVDIDHAIIPNGCIIAAAAVRAAYLVVALALGRIGIAGIGYYLASAIGVGAVLAVVMLLSERLFDGRSMGGGDLKLYCVAGFYFGWRQCIFLIFVSCVIGAVVGIASARRASADEPSSIASGALSRPFPFGPSIAVACVITMLVGGLFEGSSF